MSDVHTRPATGDDAAALARVYRRAYRENRELGFPAKAESATERDVREWVRDCRVLVATDSRDATDADGTDENSAVVGGVRLEATDPDRAKLSRLAVAPDRQGEGVGSRLLRAAHARLRADGYETVWLTTPGEHPTLPAFYRDHGYEQTGTYPLEYRDYDEIVMERALPES